MKIGIHTAHNVSIEYELAGFGMRMMAACIDVILLGIYQAVMRGIVDSQLQWAITDTPALTVLFLYLPPMLYHPFFEILMNGQSPGKKALSIRVVRLDGYEPTIGNYLTRGLFGMVEANPMVLFSVLLLVFGGSWEVWIAVSILFAGILTMIISKTNQRIGDFAAGTTVVRLTQRARLEDTIHQVIASDYKPTFTNVAMLTDRDVSLIKELLDTAVREHNSRTLDQLARKVRSVLGSSNPMPSLLFLQTVLKDYNFYTQDMV